MITARAKANACRAVSVSLLASMLLGGCKVSTRACKSGTLFLTVQLDATSASASQLDIDVALGSETKRGSVGHTPGAQRGTIEVDFGGGYPQGQAALVTVVALDGDTTLGEGMAPVTLSGACATLSVVVGRTDGGMGLVDLARNDGLGDDLAGDLSTPADGGGRRDLAAPDMPVPDMTPSGCTAANCGGTCVDGVCCNRACTGQCEACNVPGSVGTCTTVTGVPQGGRAPCTTSNATCAGACDGSNGAACTYPGASTVCAAATCANPTTLQLASTCQSGACVAPNPATQTCSGQCSGGSCGGCTSGSCATGKYCNTAGSCVAQLSNGTSCTSSTQCLEGNCVDGFCCSSTCAGLCNDCSSNPGVCQVRTGAPLSTHGSCSNTTCQQQCDGSDASSCHDPAPEPTCAAASCTASGAVPAAVCSAGSCPSVTRTPCTPYVRCSATTPTVCATSCASSTDCVSGYFCSGTSCVPLLSDGTACTASAQCANGNCVTNSTGSGATCCHTACGGLASCQVCDGTAGTAGTCSPAASGTVCGGSGTCAGTCNGSSATCNYPTTSCSSPACGVCSGGSCQGTDETKCGASCCANGCTAAGNACCPAGDRPCGSSPCCAGVCSNNTCKQPV